MRKTIGILALLIVFFGCDQVKVDYTITFDSSGGSEVLPIHVTKVTNTLEMPDDPTRLGYTFDGWFTTQNHDVPWVYSLLNTINIIVYAKWLPYEVETFTVTFDSDGGSNVGSIIDNMVLYLQIVNYPRTTVTVHVDGTTILLLNRVIFDNHYSDVYWEVHYYLESNSLPVDNIEFYLEADFITVWDGVVTADLVVYAQI
jgi:uncharacterized repeat protein (TIGR02543 family)